MDVGVFLEPALVLLMGVEIVEDDVKLAIREGGNDAVHEAEELDTAAPLGMRRDDPPGGDFKRCEQGRGAVPLVVVALAGQGASVRQLQVALRPLQGLDRRLFVDTENNRLGGRIDIEADHIGGFRHELGVVALAPGFAGDKVDIVLAQEAPDILNVNVAQCLGQQRTRPPGIAREAAAYPEAPECACSSPCRRSASCPPVDRSFSPPKAVVGKAPPPVADNPRLNAHFLGDRTRAATVSRQQHYSRPLHVALRRGRCPAARLKHLAYLRLEPNFSCFGRLDAVVVHAQRGGRGARLCRAAAFERRPLACRPPAAPGGCCFVQAKA